MAEQNAKQTIKLKPITPSEADNSDGIEETISMGRPDLNAGTSEVPGAQKTIKLRPSTNPGSMGGTATNLDMAKQTIKLTPANTTAVANDDDDNTVPLKKQTIKLTPGAVIKPSSPTVNITDNTSTATMPTRPSDPTVNINETTETKAPKKTLSLKKEPARQAVSEEQNQTDSMQKTSQDTSKEQISDDFDEEVDEGHGGWQFAVAAGIAFCLVGYLAFAMFAQANNMWGGEPNRKTSVKERDYISNILPNFDEVANGKAKPYDQKKR